MPTLPIVFGDGLDRETGVMAMQPGGMEDVRNVHLLSGKFQVRRGFERVQTFTDDLGNVQTDILAGITMRGRRAAVYVTYDSVNYKVNVFVGDASGTWSQWLAEWEFIATDDVTPILSSGNPDPPIVILAEYNSKVFMAHSVNTVDTRAQTNVVYWDSAAGTYVLHPLTCEWYAGPGPKITQKIRFRGVVTHLVYIVGWGFGDVTEDRPQLVRPSQPNVPLDKLLDGSLFKQIHYWTPGDQGDPVISINSAAETLICFKESLAYELYGSSFLDFGQRPLDGFYGVLQPRLTLNIEGSVFAWTNEGPRIFYANGTSAGLEFPLELTLPEPFDLVTKVDEKYAFAVYMPVYRSVWFVFGKRVYSLYIRIDGDWKWGYQELGFEALCGFRLHQAGWGLLGVPDGYPTSPTVSNIQDQQVDVTITTNSPDGDETLEYWTRPAGTGTYSLNKSVPATTAATILSTLTGLKAGWDYDLAVRFRRGAYYTAGYESADPDTWPSTARTTFTTTLASLATIDSLVWSRVSASVEIILITVTPPYTGTDYDVEIRRDGVADYIFTDITGTESYNDQNATPEADNEYEVRMVTPYVTGAWTAISTLWAGPPKPTLTQYDPSDSETYWVTWTNGGSYVTLVYDSLPLETEEHVDDNLRYTASAGVVTTEPAVVGSTGLQPWVGVKHKSTAFGVDDYSKLSKAQLSAPIT